MREEDSNWFSKWEDELPSPEDLMPLSQTLITPDLALAFDIRNHHCGSTPPPPPQLPQSTVLSSQPNSSEFDSTELGGGGSGGVGGGGGGGGLSSDEPARTLKRPRLVWTPQLHKRFVDAVAHLGIKNAVPKTIMQLMSVDGLTRENVASHLQKYRLYLKRMQGMSNGGGGGGNNSPVALSALGVDPAMDHLFASSPVPPHFLHPNRTSSDQFMPFAPPVVSMQPHHQMPVVGAALHHHHQQQFRPFVTPPSTGQFEHSFVRQPHHHTNNGPLIAPPHVEDLESAAPPNGRKILTLFPTADD